MEDGGGERKSIISTLCDGMEMIKSVIDTVDTIRKFESLDTKVNRLKRKLDVLTGKEDDINKELEYAESLSLKRRRQEVETWLSGLGDIKVKTHRAELEVRESKEKWLPSFRLHHKLDKLTEEIGELQNQCDFSRGLTLEAQEKRGIVFPANNMVGRMFELNKNMIWDFLGDNNVSSIGVYGMGGVGKTALLTHVHNKIIESRSDTSVYWVTVSQKFTIHKLQDDIASALMFGLYEEDERKRAAELSDFLGRKKNSVLILDDVWEYIDLQEVGIRLCVNGCKLIVTTRSLDVCRKMGFHKNIRVVPLCDAESWDLFKDKLEGNDMELNNPQIEEVAKYLVKECAGLPLGIITMARSMKGIDDVFEWKNALESMKEPRLGHIEDDMENNVFRVLKHSYDMLRDPKVQQCFLDCSMYPEDFPIGRESLVDQFIDERLIEAMKSRQSEMYRGETILNKLVNACLLENFEHRGIRYVKMHDLVRDMALRITSVRPRFLVEASVGLKEIPDEEEWVEDLIKVSLMDNDLTSISLHTSPNCPKISTMLLLGNTRLASISDSFFEHMLGLTVLDLSYSNIENLPSSLFNLVNLTSLLLIRCQRLESLPDLGNLRALRRLNLSYSGITELPRGLEILLNLRYLSLFTDSLRIVPGVFSDLTRLQFLILNWHGSDKMRVKGEELARLRRLETLKAQLYHVDDLNSYVRSLEDRDLISYILQVGFDENSFWKETEYTKVVFLTKSDITSSASEGYPISLPSGIQFLCIENCRLVRSLSAATSLENITNLRACHIIGCDGIENLLSFPLPHASHLLQSLEELRLQRLNDFKGLVGSLPPPPGAFSSLKDIIINGCPSIKTLLNPELVSQFQKLERMRILCCENMVEIVSESEIGDSSTHMSLPKLKLLELTDLPELKSVSSGKITLLLGCLEEICIEDCSSLKKLTFLDNTSLFPSLQKIKVTEKWWDSLEWEHPGAKDILRPLCQFRR